MTADAEIVDVNDVDHDLCKRAFVMAIKDALNVVSGKWKLAIVCTMLTGPKGFAEIERLLPAITARMLSRELRELEINAVVEHVCTGDAGGGKKYKLTDSGKQLEPVIFTLAGWGQEHRALTLNGAKI